MKRTISFWLVLALAFVLTGCGAAAGSSGTVPQSDNQTQDISGEDALPSDAPEAPTGIVPPSSTPAASSGTESAIAADSTASSEEEPLTFRLTIPEGYTLARIGMTLEETGICTVDEFIAGTQEFYFEPEDFPLLAQQAQNEQRCFKLEGYLYPDTYEFYTSVKPGEIMRAMLQNFERKITEELRVEITQSGYTVDEILALASIIEKEAKGPAQMGMISSVLHNRLNAGMQLECDVTIAYVEGAVKPFITGDIDRYSSYYNTYKCPALPAGAICNPRIEAILAALRPETSDYFYFLTDADGNYYYAETLEEHEANRTATGV